MIAGLEEITEGDAPHRRTRRQRRPAQGPRHRDGLPELRALPAHDGLRQHGLRAEAAQGRPRPRSSSASRTPRASSTSRSCSTASRRSSPAASASASRSAARSSASRPCSSWTSRSPTSTPSCASRRGPSIARLHQRLGNDDRLRHPRPGRGDDDGQPDRGHERRPAPAGRHAAGALRPSGQPVRGRVHRQPVDELHRRRRSTGTGDAARLKAPATSRSRPARASATSMDSAGRRSIVGLPTRAPRAGQDRRAIGDVQRRADVVEYLGNEELLHVTRGRAGHRRDRRLRAPGPPRRRPQAPRAAREGPPVRRGDG